MVVHPYPEGEWVQRFADELCPLRRLTSPAEARATGFRLWPRYGIFVPEAAAHCYAVDQEVLEATPRASASIKFACCEAPRREVVRSL